VSLRGYARRRASAIYTRLAPLATPLRLVLDVVAWVAAIFAVGWLRLNLSVDLVIEEGFLDLLPVVAILQILTGSATGLYRRRWRYGSFDEMAALCLTAGLNFTGLYLLNEFYLSPRPVPQSAVLVGSVFGLMAMAGIRYTWRIGNEYLRRPSDPTATRLLVYTDGETAAQVLPGMLSNPSSPYIPVGLLDDRLNRRRLKIRGVQVLGTSDDLEAAARKVRADGLLVALGRTEQNRLADIANRAAGCGLSVKVMPGVEDVLEGGVMPAIRDLTEEDILGRRQVDTDLAAIAGYVRGKRVLVTGAGGSIGSELCRQLARHHPDQLLMLDRDESALHAVQLSISGRALLDTPDTVLADLRDSETLERLFQDLRPEVIFHAAALKHLPLLEQYPAEAYKTNVLGTLNVLRAARNCGVEVFVNVSTDKAANPISVLGQSKRIAECLTAALGAKAGGMFLSVRFGNVLGSRGSVLVAFREQVAKGGPVTVTDPDVTRFFMTVTEAVQLVIQAGAIGRTGEVLVLDMGEPVRIYDVARRLISQSGRHIDITITGLRPGEKLHEELFGDDEADHRPRHPLVSHARVPAMDPETLPDSTAPTDVAAFMVEACSAAPRVVTEQRPPLNPMSGPPPSDL
jgi:FlaA1/EpsC-like NDP-sugar epimerase